MLAGLVYCGGGVLCNGNAIISSQLQAALNDKPVAQIFDNVTGVSGGTINAALETVRIPDKNKSYPSAYVQRLFRENTKDIFPIERLPSYRLERIWQHPIKTLRWGLDVLKNPLFDSKPLYELFRKALKHAKTHDCMTNLTIPAYYETDYGPKPIIFDSHPDNYTTSHRDYLDTPIPLADAAMGSASPYIVFPPHPVKFKHRVDGKDIDISYLRDDITALNPSDIALERLISKAGLGEEIVIISISMDPTPKKGGAGNGLLRFSNPFKGIEALRTALALQAHKIESQMLAYEKVALHVYGRPIHYIPLHVQINDDDRRKYGTDFEIFNATKENLEAITAITQDKLEHDETLHRHFQRAVTLLKGHKSAPERQAIMPTPSLARRRIA